MPLLTDWLTIFVIVCFAVMSPGPNLAVVLRNSLVYSRQAGVFTAMGLAMGIVVHTTYSLIGIGLIISRSILLFNMIKWLGAAYLIYIGFKSLQAKKQAQPHDDPVVTSQTWTMSRWAAVRTGFLTNVLNPKITLFFLALFTQVIDPTTVLPVKAMYGLTIVCVEFSWFSLVAIFISQHVIKSLFLSVSHWVERVTGVVLIMLGLRVALSSSNQ